MTISAGMVKDLREKTGVGMMECKKALEETGGDMEKAVVYLRERGLSRAASKAGRAAAEGVVQVLVKGNRGVLVELNCETDFVSKNPDFTGFATTLASMALEKNFTTLAELESAKLPTGETVKEKLAGLIAKIGENMNLRRFAALNVGTGLITGYSHMGGKIGSLVRLEGPVGPAVEELGRDLAMHVAASSPKYMKSDEVDTTELEQEKEIARKRLLEEGKPENMIEKILGGQMSKFYKEICLLEQPFVKEPKTSVSQHVDAQKLGVKLTGFVLFKLGEGVEKKKENFAEEVAAQLKK